MSFRLWTVFYVFAVVAAALATFGAWGVAIAVTVLGTWVGLFHDPPQRSLAIVLIAFLGLWFLGLLLGPAFDVGMRESGQRNQCLNEIRHLALGALNFETARHRLPPAYVADPDGMPLLSWRVEVLPYMELGIGTWPGTYFNRTRAWDDPANWTFSTTRNEDFQCPAHALSAATTDYYAVVDPRSAFRGATGRPLSDFTDGTATTIFFIECHSKQANWAEPKELTFDEAVELLSTQAEETDGHPANDGFFYKHSYGRCVAFADGHAEFLRRPLSREVAAALLTVDGGELIPDDFAVAARPELDYAKCYVFGVFATLCFVPLPWAMRRRPAAKTVEAAPVGDVQVTA